MKTIALLTCVAFTACTAAPSAHEKPFGFHLDRVGKADGGGVLDAEDLARVQEAFETAIAQGEAEIARLQAEIAKLDQANAKKQSEIDALVAQINQRRNEVERNRDLALAAAVGLGFLTFGLGAIAGAAAVASLTVALANDSRLQELNRSLSQAQSEQQSIRSQSQAYQNQKRVLEGQLALLKQSKDKLLDELQSPEAEEVPAALAPYPELAEAHRRLAVLKAILVNTNEQVDLLTQIRDAAQALSDALDRALDTLRALAADADRLAQESNDDFLKILEAVLSGYPAAVAESWLFDELAKKTHDLLVAIDFPLADFVAHLVRTRFTGTPEDLANLTTELLEKLAETGVEAATAWSWSGANDSSQPIDDLALVSSTIEVPASGRITRGAPPSTSSTASPATSTCGWSTATTTRCCASTWAAAATTSWSPTT